MSLTTTGFDPALSIPEGAVLSRTFWTIPDNYTVGQTCVMPQFSSRPPHPDTLAQRHKESWFGTAPVTLTRDGQQIDGHRQGRYGGVMVYRPERDVDFGPDRGHRVWSDGMFAELRDEEWERMGWTITVRQSNPTNRALARLRAAREDPNGYVKAGNLAALDIPLDDLTPDEIAHCVKVLIRIDRLRGLTPAA